MSSRTVDTTLRIRAQDLAGKTIEQIADDVDRLTKAQQAQAKSANLAARSSKELLAEQKELAAITKELERRSRLANTYTEQTKQITELAAKLQELTAVSKQINLGQAFGTPKQLASVDKEIVKTSNALQGLVTKNTQTGESLRALGVDTAQLGTGTSNLALLIDKAGTAYAGAVSDVRRYNDAVKETVTTQAEAQRRLAVETNQRFNTATTLAGDKNQATTMSLLRQDIELRSAQARSLEIATEAARRLAAEQAKEASQQPVINQAVREYISLANARRQRQADLNDVFGKQLTAQERLNKVEQDSVARQSRLRELVKARLEAGKDLEAEERKRAQATNQAAAADERAAKATGLFADTGRKSLSVYQRIRGQVLGLASAYIGIYQSITTVQSAIEAVNRNKALTIGLTAANGGDVAKAANDYKFLREEADRLGLVFDDVAPKFANMKIAGTAVGLSGQEIRDAFTNVATAVSAGNLSVEDSEGVFRAVVQVMSKARVQAEELRGQLGDRLPGAVAAFAKANNIALTDLDKHLQLGKGNVDEFLKFLQTYAAQYAPVLDEATNSLQASINRARNAYNDWLRDLLNAGNQTKLKNAFSAITEFFNGQQGKDFAEGLGQVFSFLVDTFILLAKHVDILAATFKVLVAVQVAKFGADIASSMVGAYKGVVSFAKAAGTAATATTVLSGEMRLLQLALGPVGIALLAAGTAFAALSTGAAKADADASKFINTLHRVNQAKGTADITAGMSDLRTELKGTNADLDKLYEIRNNFNSINPVKGIKAVVDAATRNLVTQAEIDGRIAELRARQLSQMQLLEVATKRLTKAKATEAEQDKQEAAAAKTIRDAAKGAADAEDADKARKKQEAADKAALDAQNRKSNAERAFDKESLDIKEQIQKLQIDTGLVTAKQIEDNYQAQVKQGGLIDTQIAERRLELEKLQQNAATAGVDSSAKSTTIDGQLIRLDAQLRARAEQTKAAAELELHEKAINDLIEARDGKIQLINALQQNGSLSQLDAWRQTNETQDQYNAKIREQISLFQAWISSIDPNSDLYKRLGLDKVTQGLALANAQAQKLSNLQLFSQKYGEQLASGFSNAMGALAEGLAGAIEGTNSWSDAFKSAGDAFRSFAADFLVQIGKMIVQAVIFQAIQNAVNKTSGGYYGAIVSAFTGHTGGVVSGGTGRIAGNKSKSVNPAVFAGAQRFHSGGFPGLAKNEVPAILKKKEEVLTEDDPRNALNGGAAGAGPVSFSPTIVNTIDSEAVVRQGMTGKNGQLFINDVLGKNKNQVKKILGIS